MWFGTGSPYQGMLSGMMGRGATPMTPGAGMPPQGNAPMNMQMPQMQTPQVAQSNVPLPQPQGQGRPSQQPMNPAQMGMLSQMLQQQTGQPIPAVPTGAPGQGASRQAGYGEGAPQGGTDLMGMLRMAGMLMPMLGGGMGGGR